MTKTGTFNDKSHSFKRWERRITKDVHNGLVSIGSSYSSLYCSCCSALRSTDIFPTRAFQVGVSGVHAGWSLGCSERKICLQQADGPLWSPARCFSFIFNLVYRAYNQKGAKCFYISRERELHWGASTPLRAFWSYGDFSLASFLPFSTHVASADVASEPEIELVDEACGLVCDS